MYGGLSRRSMHGVGMEGGGDAVVVNFDRFQQAAIDRATGGGGGGSTGSTPKAGAAATASTSLLGAPGGATTGGGAAAASGGGGGFLDAVQASRFVFSMSIVIEHSLAQCMGRSGKGIQKFGFLWTQMFFIISGFVLTYSTRSRGFPASLKGRVVFLMQRFMSVWYPYVFVWMCTNGLRLVMGRHERVSKGGGTYLHVLTRFHSPPRWGVPSRLCS